MNTTPIFPSSGIEIRKILKEEFSLIRHLPPIDWNIDLEKVYDYHYEEDYFYPIVAIIDTEIIGTGIAIINDNSTWLGTIIVKEDHRNKGIGKMITNRLIEYSKSKGNDTIILSATNLGLPVYTRIGFLHDLDYQFFKTDNRKKFDSISKNISEINIKDFDRIFELDLAISGERRKNLLINSLKTGFKYMDKDIKGYYLPNFGTGLIIADSEIPGLELLKFRLSRDTSAICIPETNNTAIGFLNSLGYYQFLKTPRMFLNKNVKWDSKNVYSRGCGYLG
jgi:GNAT superfamily N-acetyltransferase